MTSAGRSSARAPGPTTPAAQRLEAITRGRFGLIRFRSPLLTEYPFLQVLRCFTSLRTPRSKAVPAHTAGGSPHSEILGSKPCRRLPEAYRGPTRPSSVLSAKASTIRPCQQHTPTQGMHAARTFCEKLWTTHHHTMNDHKTIDQIPNPKESETGLKKLHLTKQESYLARVHYPVLKPPRASGSGAPSGAAVSGRHRIAPTRGRGGDPGAQKHAHTTDAL